jgi:hypothetical protein
MGKVVAVVILLLSPVLAFASSADPYRVYEQLMDEYSRNYTTGFYTTTEKYNGIEIVVIKREPVIRVRKYYTYPIKSYEQKHFPSRELRNPISTFKERRGKVN